MLNNIFDVFFFFRMLKEIIPNIVIQVKQDVKTVLSDVGAPELTPSVEAILEGQILDLVNEDHKIRQLVSKYIFIKNIFSHPFSLKIFQLSTINNFPLQIYEYANFFRK